LPLSAAANGGLETGWEFLRANIDGGAVVAIGVKILAIFWRTGRKFICSGSAMASAFRFLISGAMVPVTVAADL